MTPDYLPLTPGLRLDYEVRRAGATLRLAVEHSDGGGGTTLVRRTWTSPDGSSQSETARAERRADGVYEDGLLVLPLPPQPGTSWSVPPIRHAVEGAGAVAEVPAGRFADCLKVSYLIAGGDGGSGERLYAPGVGVVSELCADEADPFEARLVARRSA
ncbi:MAG: hypothetical protein KGM24_11575 [Elusimicrobia bacterium]|nr:hypothetical protein [Elusimicrobiota bacterium]